MVQYRDTVLAGWIIQLARMPWIGVNGMIVSRLRVGHSGLISYWTKTMIRSNSYGTEGLKRSCYVPMYHGLASTGTWANEVVNTALGTNIVAGTEWGRKGQLGF